MLKTAVSFEHLQRKVGNTPMIEITYRYKNGPACKLWVKCEYYNGITGSIKDRMALYIIQKAYATELIKPGDIIIEATSGNTGIAFAAIGEALGHPVHIIMPDWVSTERITLLESYGAKIQLVSREDGGFKRAIHLAELNQHNERMFLPRQFENKYNIETHEKTTGREIGHQLMGSWIKPAAFVAGVGTGGTIMGVGRYLRARFPDIKIHPLFPSENKHRIQGIGDDFIPPIVDLKALDEPVSVNDGDAILMAKKICAELKLGVGISSGANLLGAIKIQQQMDPTSVVVTVFPDSNKKYLSTDLFQAEPVKDGYFSPDVELLDYQIIRN